MKTRVTYHYVLCWEKYGQVFTDAPCCNDYTDKQEAIRGAEMTALKIKPGQWIVVFEVEEKWNEDEQIWEAEDFSEWTVVHETEDGK